MPILEAWEQFGDPVMVGTGLVVVISDRSAQLYDARRSWLTEHGITAHGVRELWLRGWRALDREGKRLMDKAREEAAAADGD